MEHGDLLLRLCVALLCFLLGFLLTFALMPWEGAAR